MNSPDIGPNFFLSERISGLIHICFLKKRSVNLNKSIGTSIGTFLTNADVVDAKSKNDKKKKNYHHAAPKTK